MIGNNSAKVTTFVRASRNNFNQQLTLATSPLQVPDCAWAVRLWLAESLTICRVRVFVKGVDPASWLPCWLAVMIT